MKINWHNDEESPFSERFFEVAQSKDKNDDN